MMAEIKIHVFHTGEACVAPDLPFGGEHCSTIKASGAFAKKSERLWLPVSAYLIECSHGKIIFDCGWHRNMSPDGVFDKKAQIKSLGSLPLYVTNQGRIEKGLAIDEQLAALGIHPADLDLVLLSHLDCDHTNGLNLVADAKQILVSKDELLFAENKTPVNRIRYNADWWRSTKMQTFDWNGTEGLAGKSYDVFGDESLVNVLFGESAAVPTDENAQKALELAQASEFVEKLPGKLDAPISQGGSNVSGGQKQRLAIARALARNPEILIFDDSFSALDYKTDAALRKGLAEKLGGVTCMIVAQRIGTIRNADKIVVLDEGKAVGIGTHEELIKNCAVYREIAMSQLSAEELGA